MRIGELLKQGVSFFEKEGLEPAELLAERLLEGVLSKKRYELYLNAAEEIPQEWADRYWQLLRRRLEGIPSQYLLGKAEFMDFTLEVDPRCLIPRPETEILVEKVLEKVNSLGWKRKPLRILDLGTGSGNIAIALASYLPCAQVTAVDISEGALEVALGNARLNEAAHRIRFLKTDLFRGLPETVFDLVVSNPPYLSGEEIVALPKEVVHEPRLALYGGKKGTEFIERMVTEVRAWLSEGGFFGIEIGAGQSAAVSSLLTHPFWDAVEIYKDMNGWDRILLGARKL